jgi:hypothetical protein
LTFPTQRRWPTWWGSPYDEAMNESEGPAEESTTSPVDAFLKQPAYHASEDPARELLTPTHDYVVVGSFWRRLSHRFTHFMFEKEPGQYSSISPRTTDGKRTKIFFFNGNGRGR